MENQAVLERESNAGILYLAFGLSRKKWKLGFSDGRASQIRQVGIEAQDLEAYRKEMERAKQRFRLDERVEVRSCYEAGREGFWLHRALEQMGIHNMVVDASSIEVNRRQRQARPDGCGEVSSSANSIWEGRARRLERRAGAQPGSRR